MSLVQADHAVARTLEFHASGTFVALATLAAVVAFALCVAAWIRSGRKPSFALLEALRFALVCVLLFALAQPELVEVRTPESAPEVAVLWDDSLSMGTRDVASGEAVVSRAEDVARRLDDISAEGFADDRFDVVTAPLSQFVPRDEGASIESIGTDLTTPLDAVLTRPELRAVVVVSDGDWNEGGAPYDVAMRYRLAEVPIFTSCIGSPTRLPDVVLEPVDPPAFAVAGRPIEIPITIDSAMPRDVTTEVVLSDESGVIERRAITLPARRRTSDRLVFRPEVDGRTKLTVALAPVAGELDEGNNRHEFEIDVRAERLRVLLVEGMPRWEYRYLRNALVRDPGVEVDCYLRHPALEEVGGGPRYLGAFPAKEDLGDYDVVFIGDVELGEDGLSEDECEMIAGLVRDQASGLILMPGFGGGHLDLATTELGELFPVELDATEPHGVGGPQESKLVLTEAGRESSLTRLLSAADENSDLWRDLPGFQWHAPVVRARAGSQVLAVHSSSQGAYGRLPLLATRTARTGKVLFMGTDAAWRWREGYEDRYHYRFWGQVIRWMAYQRSMNAGDSMRLFFTPDRPRARSTIALNANVMDAAGAPLADATVRARIEAPSGRVERVDFRSASDGNDQDTWGLYSAAFRPREGGRHRVVLECVETGATLEAEIPVIGRPLEAVGMPARYEVLAEIASLTRGEAMERLTAESLADRLRALPEPPPIETRLRIWSHPALGALVVLLMAALWIGRKAVGRV